jgi:hypothetical protein
VRRPRPPNVSIETVSEQSLSALRTQPQQYQRISKGPSQISLRAFRKRQEIVGLFAIRSRFQVLMSPPLRYNDICLVTASANEVRVNSVLNIRYRVVFPVLPVWPANVFDPFVWIGTVSFIDTGNL